MLRFATLAIVATLSMSFANFAQADDTAEIMKKFVGRWHVDEGVSFGTPIPEEELDGTVTVITKDKITTYDKDQNVTYAAAYTLNTKTDPMQIDMVSERNGKKMKALGIIKFEWLDLDGEEEFELAYSLAEVQPSPADRA